MNGKIKRKIYFYLVDIGNEPSGEPKLFDPKPTLEHIHHLKFEFPGKYWEDEGKIICAWVDGLSMPYKLRLGTIRRNELPQIENQGEIIPLEIPENFGLVELTHIVFLEKNIIGCDFNYYGPRISRLSYYMAEKAKGIAPEFINFNPLLRKDVYNQLKKLKFIRMVDLKIKAPFAEKISTIDMSLGNSFQAALDASKADLVELILQPSKFHRGWLSSRLNDILLKLAKQPDLQYEAEKFKVSGFNSEKDKLIDLDLLSDKLIISKDIYRAQPRSKALNPIYAYNAITAAYDELKQDILAAASIGI